MGALEVGTPAWRQHRRRVRETGNHSPYWQNSEPIGGPEEDFRPEKPDVHAALSVALGDCLTVDDVRRAARESGAGEVGDAVAHDLLHLTEWIDFTHDSRRNSFRITPYMTTGPWQTAEERRDREAMSTLTQAELDRRRQP